MTRGHRRSVLSAVLAGYGFVCVACTQSGELISSSTGLVVPAKVEPRPAESYLTLGNRLLAAGEPDLAMKAFLRSMSVDGITAPALTGAGIAYEQQGLLTAARQYFEQASQMAPNSMIAHNNLGVVLFKLKEYYLARNEFRSAFALSNGTSEMAERNLNRTEAMIAAMETIPETDLAISHGVISLGGGEYRLVELDAPKTDAMAE